MGDHFILGDTNAICGVKMCSRCKETKPTTYFSRDRYRESGLKSACKACSNGYFSQWRARNINEVRRSDRINHYVREYGLPLEQAESLADGNRHGICAICGTATNLVVDHCHKSGAFRARICSPCNSAIGYAKENIQTLENMIAYIKRYGNA